MTEIAYLIKETAQHFSSGNEQTPAYLAWHKLFKRVFSAYVTEKFDAKKIQFEKAGYFSLDLFFETAWNQIFRVTLIDVRGFKDSLLVKRAKSFDDYIGQDKQWVNFLNAEMFEKEFDAVVKHI